MKILLGTLYPNLGGSTRVLLAAARALASEHEVVVRAPLREATHPSPTAMPLEPLIGAGAKARALPALGLALARELAFVRKTRPDVLYVHDEPALYVYGTIGRLLGIPLVWHIHMSAGRGWRARLRMGLADEAIFISRFTARASGLHADHPTIIHNPLPFVPPPPDGSAGESSLPLAVVGAVSARKNQALALETLAALRDRGRDAHLTLIGPEIEPAYRRALRARTEALGLSRRVRFTGPLPPEEAWRADAIALFPATYENQPLALLEALAGGRRVVAADIPAHREIVDDAGAAGVPLVPHSAAAFADAVERVAATLPAPESARRVRELFATERFEDAVRAFYRKLDGRSRGC